MVTVAAAAAVLALAAASASAYVSSGLGVSVATSGSDVYAYYYESFSSAPTIAVSIVRGGSVVASQTGSGFGTSLSAAPAAGDTVRIEQPPGTPVQSVAFNLTIDPSTCVGSTTISGQRSAAAQQVMAYAYAPSQYASYRQAQITTLSAASYAGTFTKPLALGEHVVAEENAFVTQPDSSFSYFAAVDQAVGACPAPPPPNVTPSVTPRKPKGKMALRKRHALRALLRKRLAVTVSIDQPGTVAVNLFLDNGKLPAKATKKRKRKATLVGRGVVKAGKAGSVKVRVRPTRAARKLRRKRKAKLVVLTTLTNAAKQTTNLQSRITLKR